MPMVRCGNNENDRIYNAIVARGVTPASDSTDDLIAAIALIDTTHSVSVYVRYTGNTSMQWTSRVDGVQRGSGYFEGDGTVSLTV